MRCRQFRRPNPRHLLLFFLLFGIDGIIFTKQSLMKSHANLAKFSSSPSGLPSRKVNFMGKEVHLRQLFVEPIRPVENRAAEKRQFGQRIVLGCSLANDVIRDRKRRRKRQGCFACGCPADGYGDASCGGPPFSSPCVPSPHPTSFLPTFSGPSIQSQPQYKVLPSIPSQPLPGSIYALSNASSSPSYQIIPSSLATTEAQPENIAWQQQQQRQGEVEPSKKSSESEYTSAEAATGGGTIELQSAAAKQRKQHDYPSQFSLPPPNLLVPSRQPPPVAYQRFPPPSSYVKKPKSPYPLPECYTDSSNFMCCNGQLEDTINKAYDSLVRSIPSFHKCNVQKIANRIQEETERRFNTSFEVVVGLNDYASKSHFFHNYICKIERDNRFVMAYATPRWDLEASQEEGALLTAPSLTATKISKKSQKRSPNANSDELISRIHWPEFNSDWQNHVHQCDNGTL